MINKLSIDELDRNCNTEEPTKAVIAFGSGMNLVQGEIKTNSRGKISFKATMSGENSRFVLSTLTETDAFSVPSTIMTSFIYKYMAQKKSSIQGNYHYDPSYLAISFINTCIDNRKEYESC